jgi:hypothetical protein
LAKSEEYAILVNRIANATRFACLLRKTKQVFAWKIFKNENLPVTPLLLVYRQDKNCLN